MVAGIALIFEIYIYIEAAFACWWHCMFCL